MMGRMTEQSPGIGGKPCQNFPKWPAWRTSWTRICGAPSVTKIQIVSFAVLKTADPPFTALEGRTVTGVRRFGKFVSLDAGGISSFVFHLARAGWVRFTDSPTDAQLKMGKGHIAARLSFRRRLRARAAST